MLSEILLSLMILMVLIYILIVEERPIRLYQVVIFIHLLQTLGVKIKMQQIKFPSTPPIQQEEVPVLPLLFLPLLRSRQASVFHLVFRFQQRRPLLRAPAYL